MRKDITKLISNIRSIVKKHELRPGAYARWTIAYAVRGSMLYRRAAEIFAGMRDYRETDEIGVRPQTVYLIL